jgi:hypothetical protein
MILLMRKSGRLIKEQGRSPYEETSQISCIWDLQAVKKSKIWDVAVLPKSKLLINGIYYY